MRTVWGTADELDCALMFGPFKTIANNAKGEDGTESS